MTTLDELTRSPPEPSIKLPEKDWRRIEATLGIEKPDPGFRRRVANRVNLYLPSPAPQLDRVRPGHLRKSITKILKDARQLRADLVFEDEEEDQEDLQEWARAVVVFTITLRVRKTLQSSLEETIKTLESHLASLPPDKGGRSRNPALFGLIWTLADIYRDAKRKKPTVSHNPGKVDIPYEPYGGPFYEFVRAFLRTFAPDFDEGNQALGKSIQRTLKHWSSHKL